jgi:predicted cobalt transporter CbtA
MCGAYLIMPPNPDEVSAPMDLVQGFRIASVFTMSIFWGLLGLILGVMWDRVKPHETAEVTTH